MNRSFALPEVDLTHLRAMTDDTGLLQHAAWSVPRYEDGYCLDDNARALVLLALLEEASIEPTAVVRLLATRYLAYVRSAFDREQGRFRNFLSYARQWTEPCGSEDSHGRAIWSLGAVLGRSRDSGRRELASETLRAALPATLAFTSPRAWAYTLLGLGECFGHIDRDDAMQSIGRTLALRLLELFRRCGQEDWPWFEDRLTYANARLPQAIMLAGEWMEDDEMVTSGLRSLDWLASIQRTDGGLFAPIGSNGFFVRGQTKATFDQQPIEACGMISACLHARRLTGDRTWVTRAQEAFDWFLGGNQLHESLYDPSTGGCRDGLHRDRANENQGAESTLSFLMALMEWRTVDPLGDSEATPRTGKLRQMAAETTA